MARPGGKLAHPPCLLAGTYDATHHRTDAKRCQRCDRHRFVISGEGMHVIMPVAREKADWPEREE